MSGYQLRPRNKKQKRYIRKRRNSDNTSESDSEQILDSTFQPVIRSTLAPELEQTPNKSNPEIVTKSHTDRFFSCKQSTSSIDLLDTEIFEEEIFLEDSTKLYKEKIQVDNKSEGDILIDNTAQSVSNLGPVFENLIENNPTLEISLQSKNDSNTTVIINTPSPTGSITNSEKIVTAHKITTSLLELIDRATSPNLNMVNEGDGDGTAEENLFETTVAQAVQQKHTPILPKFEHPQKFDPAFGDAVKFLKNFDTVTSANRWTNSHKLAYFGSYLEGYANDWYERYLTQVENAGKNWQQVKEDFLLEYVQENPTRDIRRSLAQRKQRLSEDIKQYFYNILELCGEIDAEMNADLIRDHFENGLHEIYKDQFLILSSPQMSLQELKSVVNKLHNIHLRAIQKEANQQASNWMAMQTKNKYLNNNGYSRMNAQRRDYNFPNNNRTNYFNTPRQYTGNRGEIFGTTRPGYPQNNGYNNNTFGYSKKFFRPNIQGDFRQNYIRPENSGNWQNFQYRENPQQRPFFPNQNQKQINETRPNQNKFQPRINENNNATLLNTRSRAGQVVCWNCNKVGHHLRNCDQPIAGPSNQNQAPTENRKSTPSNGRSNGNDSHPNFQGRR